MQRLVAKKADMMKTSTTFRYIFLIYQNGRVIVKKYASILETSDFLRGYFFRK